MSGRAKRFRFAIDRKRLIARRGLPRTVLGDYLELGAESLAVGETEHGQKLPPDLHGSLHRGT